MSVIKKPIFALLIFCTSACHSISDELKSKYGFMLLSEDYGILEESDFKPFTEVIEYDLKQKIQFSGFYWKCYPSENISFDLTGGKSSDGRSRQETMSHLTLIAKINEKTKHEYLLRRGLPVSENKRMLNQWQWLIKNEPYVCVNGQGFNDENKEIIYSMFEGIKTKKGCFYYLHGECNYPEPNENWFFRLRKKLNANTKYFF